MSFNAGFEKLHSFCPCASYVYNHKVKVLATSEETKETHNFIKSLRDATHGNFQTEAELARTREHERHKHPYDKNDITIKERKIA